MLNSIGPKAYKLVRDLCSPDTPNTKSYAELCKILKEYYTQPVIAFKERQEFYTLMKTECESSVEWMARVKSCASNCDFAERLANIVLDKFVTGQSARIFERLRRESLNFDVNQGIGISIEIRSAKDFNAIGERNQTSIDES